MADIIETRELELELDMPKGGAWSWFFQRFSGAILLILVLLHLLFVRILEDSNFLGLKGKFLGLKGGAEISLIAERLAKTGYLAVDLILVIFVIYHALNGLRMILNDMFDSESVQRIISIVLLVLGILIVIFGGYVLFVIPTIST